VGLQILLNQISLKLNLTILSVIWRVDYSLKQAALRRHFQVTVAA
jgi:hypothetical protein